MPEGLHGDMDLEIGECVCCFFLIYVLTIVFRRCKACKIYQENGSSVLKNEDVVADQRVG